MARFFGYLTAIVLATGFVFLTASLLPAKPQRQPQCVQITEDSITLKSKDGKHTLTLKAWDDGVGVFVSQGDITATLVSGEHQGVYFGIVDGKSKGCPIALACDKDGGCWIQVLHGETIRHIEPKDLIAGGDK